jgi:hypothetical protein
VPSSHLKAPLQMPLLHQKPLNPRTRSRRRSSPAPLLSSTPLDPQQQDRRLPPPPPLQHSLSP